MIKAAFVDLADPPKGCQAGAAETTEQMLRFDTERAKQPAQDRAVRPITTVRRRICWVRANSATRLFEVHRTKSA